MRSKFQFVASHLLNTEAVINVGAGTNWADKYNFLEIKPSLNELHLLGTILKDRSQAYQGDNTSSDIFSREGFRPIIFSIKQLPFNVKGSSEPFRVADLEKCVHLAQEWYFDCHRLLNGKVVMHGSSEYIPVGDNIMFDAKLLGLTPNYNSASTTTEAIYTAPPETIYVLAHVETVQHSFYIDSDGARSFRTTISFVRGILVDRQKKLIGSGTIDTLASSLSYSNSRNSETTIAVGEHEPKLKKD
jgi:hypothetical protein